MPAADSNRMAPELAAQLRERPDQPLSVLIEVDVPSPQAAVRQRRSGSAQVDDLTTLDTDDQRRRDAAVEELRTTLTDVLGSEPRFFKYANAFGATANAEQLARIVDSPHVRVVRANRRTAG
jgi:hypothetical protein